MKRSCRMLWADRRELPAMLRIIDRSGIAARQIALPVDRVIRERTFAQKNAEYAECAIPLAERAARAALDRAHLAPDQIDLLVTTSCTGIMIPSLSSFLMPRLGMRSDCVRLPITELGCAAGAAAIARANEYCLAHPGRIAMVLACELPSLTFQRQDMSMTNFIAAAIFGDGAACAIVGGPPVASSPDVVSSRSHLFPDSHRLMGFDVGEGGFHIVLASDVPEFLQGKVRPLVQKLCDENGVALESLAFAAIHPGGRRILENLESDLKLAPEVTAHSWEVLNQHGNMSSATVLFVLDRLLRSPHRHTIPEGAHGLLAAFGPGFSAEISLLRWHKGHR